MRFAFSVAFSKRKKSVLIPLINKNASNDCKTDPCNFLFSAIPSQNSSGDFTDNEPDVMSEWPFRYLVAECIEISAPKFNALVAQGGVAVQSVRSFAPLECAMSAAFEMSVTAQSGLFGVSTQTRAVLSRIALESSSKFPAV